MKKIILNQLSETIKSERKSQGLTQLDLSKKTGLNRSMLSKIETSEYMPSIEQLELICDTQPEW